MAAVADMRATNVALVPNGRGKQTHHLTTPATMAPPPATAGAAAVASTRENTAASAGSAFGFVFGVVFGSLSAVFGFVLGVFQQMCMKRFVKTIW
jgi:hypothetical protein